MVLAKKSMSIHSVPRRIPALSSCRTIPHIDVQSRDMTMDSTHDVTASVASPPFLLASPNVMGRCSAVSENRAPTIIAEVMSML